MGVRERVARNLNVQGLKKVLSLMTKPIRIPFQDIASAGRLKRLAEEPNDPNRLIRVAFLLQCPEIWDKMEGVYEEMWRSDEFEPVIVTVPDPGLDSWDERGLSEMSRTAERYCAERYWNRLVVRSVDDNGAVMDVAKQDYDYVFYQRQYDAKLPRQLRSHDVSRSSRVCFITYGYNLASSFEDKLLVKNREFTSNAYFIFACSDDQALNTLRTWSKRPGARYRHIESFGYPVLARFVRLGGGAGPCERVLWMPRWSSDPDFGGSHFLDYRDCFPALAERGFDLMLRPHQLLWGELVQRGMMSAHEIADYKKRLESLNVQDGWSGSCEDNFKWCDVAIMDFSSTVVECFLTGKPIIYCPAGFDANSVMRELLKGMYIAYSWDDVMAYLDMLKHGDDPKRELRSRISEQLFPNLDDAAAMICMALIEDVKLRGSEDSRRNEKPC